MRPVVVGTGPGPSRLRHSAPWASFACLAAVLPLVLAMPGVVAGATPAFHPLSTETPLCATLVSNATLNQTYDGIYTGLPTLLKNWSPSPNASRPANQSAYPNLTVGEEEMFTAWTSICSSSEFTTLYDQLGGTSFTSGFELNVSGDYVANYGFQWIVSCVGFTNQSGVECEKSVLWYHDLATGATSGAVTREWAAVPMGGPPGAAGSSPSSSPRTFLGLPDLEAYALLTVVALVAAALVVAVVLHRRGTR